VVVLGRWSRLTLLLNPTFISTNAMKGLLSLIFFVRPEISVHGGIGTPYFNIWKTRALRKYSIGSSNPGVCTHGQTTMTGHFQIEPLNDPHWNNLLIVCLDWHESHHHWKQFAYPQRQSNLFLITMKTSWSGVSRNHTCSLSAEPASNSNSIRYPFQFVPPQCQRRAKVIQASLRLSQATMRACLLRRLLLQKSRSR